MVDMFIHYEEAKSMALMATLKIGEPAEARARAVSAAKVQIGRSARFIGQESVQLHGGMGMTDELRVGHYFKRLTTIEATVDPLAPKGAHVDARALGPARIAAIASHNVRGSVSSISAPALPPAFGPGSRRWRRPG